MRKVSILVLAGGLLLGLLAPRAAMANFTESQVKGTYISQFDLWSNDAATPDSVATGTAAGLVQFYQELAKDLTTKGNLCASISFPGGLTAKTVSTALKGFTAPVGSQAFGEAAITYDGTGSFAGAGVFNIFFNGPYSQTKDPQALNAAALGSPVTICGGPNAGSLSPACTIPCFLDGSTQGKNAPYNCGAQYESASSSNLNPGGGGYCTPSTSGGKCLASGSGPAYANDRTTESAYHSYYSSLGLCPTATSDSFADCCSDAKLDIVVHVVASNALSTAGGTATQSYGTFGDGWTTGNATQLPTQ